MGYFSIPFQQFSKDDISDWASAFTLLGAFSMGLRVNGRNVKHADGALGWWTDTIETYFDSRIDLFQRNFTKQSDKLRMRAEETLKRIRAEQALKEHREKLPKDLEREVQKLKLKVRFLPPPPTHDGTNV